MNFEDTLRTKKHVILNLPDKETSQVLDPFSTKEQEVKLFNKILAPSINDDFLFDFKGKEVLATNLKAGSERKSLMGIPDGCSLRRPRESEQVAAERGLDDIILTLDCLDKFEIINGGKATMYSS